MYIKLLNEAVLEEKGEKIPERIECKLDLKVNAYIPESYISSSSLRMEMYKRIALILDKEDAQDLEDEMLDRFGEYPPETDALIKVACLKALAEKSGIERIVQNEGNVNIYPKDLKVEVWSLLDFPVVDYKLRINLTSGTCISIKIPKNSNAVDSCLDVLEQYFSQCSQCDN